MLIEDIKASGNNLAVRLISGFDRINDKTIAGIKQEVDKNIILFATNKKVARSVRRPIDEEKEVTPKTLETNSVFIIVQDAKLELYAPLLRLITSQNLQYLSTRPNGATPHILIALDEFSSLGDIDILPALRKLRKKNVRILFFTQSIADLDLAYGTAKRRAMLNNIAYKVVLSATDYDTQRYFSDLAGEQNIIRKTYITGIKGESESQTVQREKVMFPEEFAKLGNHLVLLHPAGKKNFYFKRH